MGENRTPTQAAHPWRATIRTVVALLVGLCALIPSVAAETGLADAFPWVAGVVAVAATVTRVLAIPAVDAFLSVYVPWLSAAGRR